MTEYSDKDLEALISEVETEFNAHLYKNEGDKETETDVLAKSENAQEEVEAAAEVQDEETQELAKSEKDEDLNYDDEDIKEMNELYASMSKSEKEAHYKAIKSILFTEDSEDSNEDSTIAKSEKSNEESDVEAKDSSDDEILAKNEELAKENEELKKSVSKLVSILTEKVQKGSAPKQKAITEIQYMKKSEEEAVEANENEIDVEKLSKAEIASKLKEKARTEDLKKSDRDRINAYMFDEIGIDKIKDLL